MNGAITFAWFPASLVIDGLASETRDSRPEALMRQIRYGVAMSLDGYIADANGGSIGSSWILTSTSAAIMARYDTLLMGRRTYEVTQAMGGGGGDSMPGVKTIVVSRTLQQRDHPDITILSEDWESAVRALRDRPGKDIWLFGGGELFGAMLDAGLVDGVDTAIIPCSLEANSIPSATRHPRATQADQSQALREVRHRQPRIRRRPTRADQGCEAGEAPRTLAPTSPAAGPHHQSHA